jgi:hypothetical protein
MLPNKISRIFYQKLSTLLLLVQCGNDINYALQNPFLLQWVLCIMLLQVFMKAICIVLRLGAAELHTASRDYLMWRAELNKMTCWYSKTLYCSWHCWSSTVNNSNKFTCCSSLLCNNSLCHTNPVYNKESQQFFHTCSRSKYCSVTFVQHKLMYSLMLDQLGPKHVVV